jgi:hypothetical protein
VSYDPETPFDSIEGSQEYVALLAEAIEEARQDVDADIAVPSRRAPSAGGRRCNWSATIWPS